MVYCEHTNQKFAEVLYFFKLRRTCDKMRILLRNSKARFEREILRYKHVLTNTHTGRTYLLKFLQFGEFSYILLLFYYIMYKLIVLRTFLV